MAWEKLNPYISTSGYTTEAALEVHAEPQLQPLHQSPAQGIVERLNVTVLLAFAHIDASRFHPIMLDQVLGNRDAHAAWAEFLPTLTFCESLELAGA